MNQINSFSGKYNWLSNFYPCTITLDDVTYPSVEHAYQASKTLDHTIRQNFLVGTPGQAKKLGKTIKLRPKWNKIKVGVMQLLLNQKFTTDNELGQKLIETYPMELIEGNQWHDTFWGVYNGIGDNRLGKLLMMRRLTLMSFSFE